MFAAESLSSVGSNVDLRKGGRWFDPWLGQYSFRGLMIVVSIGFIPICCFNNGCVGKQAVGWGENCVEYW